MYLLEPHPILLSTSSLVLYTHGLFFSLGAVISTLWLIRLTRGLSLKPLEIVERCFWIFLAGLFCARLGYLVVYLNTWTSVSQLWEIWQGGLLSYTGILGSLFVAWLFARKLPEKERWQWADALMQAALLGWAIGRVGNYYAADSVGVLSTTWSAFYGRVPIQLFEVILCGLLVFGLNKVPAIPAGRRAFYGLLGYLAGRFVIDIWRDEGSFLYLHASQWVSLLSVIGIYFLFRRFLKRPHVS